MFSIIQYYLNPFFIRIIQDLLVAEPDTTVEKKIKSEANIGYNELCLFKQYSISTKYIVNEDGDSSTMTDTNCHPGLSVLCRVPFTDKRH